MSESQISSKKKKTKKDNEKKETTEVQFPIDERTKPSILSDTGFRPGQDSIRSSLTSVTPTSGPIVIKVAKEDEDKSIRQLGSFNAEHAFVSMLQVLEKHHDKGPFLDKQPNFKAPPDDSLNIFKLENLEKSIDSLEKKVKLVSRRLAESKREKAEVVRRIEYLENKLIQRGKEEMVATFMKEQPTEKDLVNLHQLQEKLNSRSKSHKELKQLQKQREMLNKTLKNAENIITDSSVIKRPRHVIIIEPNLGIERERSRASKDTRLAQLQMDEKEQAKTLLGSKENLLASTSVDELSTLQTNSGESLDNDLLDIKNRKRMIRQMLKQQDIGLENESPDRDPWTGEKLKPPGENQVHQSSSNDSFNSSGSKQTGHGKPKEAQSTSLDVEDKTVNHGKTHDKPKKMFHKISKEKKTDIIPQSRVNQQTIQPETLAEENIEKKESAIGLPKSQSITEDKDPKEVKTEIEGVVDSAEPVDKRLPTSPPDENREETISTKNAHVKQSIENLDAKPSEIKSIKEEEKGTHPTIDVENVDANPSEIKSKKEEKNLFEESQPSTSVDNVKAEKEAISQVTENPVKSQTSELSAQIKENEQKIPDKQELKDIKTLKDSKNAPESREKTLDKKDSVISAKSMDDQKVAEQPKGSENLSKKDKIHDQNKKSQEKIGQDIELSSNQSVQKEEDEQKTSNDKNFKLKIKKSEEKIMD